MTTHDSWLQPNPNILRMYFDTWLETTSLLYDEIWKNMPECNSAKRKNETYLALRGYKTDVISEMQIHLVIRKEIRWQAILVASQN